MKQLLFFLSVVFSIVLKAQTPIDTTTYELTLNNGRTSLVKIIEVKKGEYIKVVDEYQTNYTFDWDAFKFYKPVYPKPEPEAKKVIPDKRFDANYNASGYVPKVPGKKQRNVGIALFAIGAGILAAAIPMVATASSYQFSYYQNSNGQSYSKGDPKGGFGVVMFIPGVGLTITGAVLWGKGGSKMKRFKKSKAAIEG